MSGASAQYAPKFAAGCCATALISLLTLGACDGAGRPVASTVTAGGDGTVWVTETGGRVVRVRIRG